MTGDINNKKKSDNIRPIIARPEIIRFAEAMERLMHKHDNIKGDSWKEMPHGRLQKMMLKEVEETKEENAMLSEWVDIANFCMMIYSNTVRGYVK